MKVNFEKNIYKFILEQFKNYWIWYLGALICLFATHFIGSHLPKMAQELAELVETGPEKIETYKFFLLALGIIFFRTFSRILFFYPARDIEKNMRIKILQGLENRDPDRYKEYSPGQLFQVIYADVDQVRALLGFALLQVGNIAAALIVLVPTLMLYNAKLVYALSPMLASSLLFTLVVSRMRHYHRKAQDAQGDVQNFIMESYIGKKTIKNYHAEKSFIQLFIKNSFRELFLVYKAGIGISFSIPLVPLGVGMSLIWGGYLIRSMDLGATSLIFFSGFVYLFLEPLMFLSWIGIVFTTTIGSWNRINELIDSLQTESNKEKILRTFNPPMDQKKDKDKAAGSDNLNLLFWDKKLPLSLKRHAWTVFVGKTGCGKSTVLLQIAAILRLHGKEISVVGQNPYLYNDTVRANIFLGNEKAALADGSKIDEAYALLKLFDLSYLAESCESLMNMQVGENGKRLSGGQAKRLCLVRSLVSKAEYLLWDDPFSSVDVILERKIVESLRKASDLKNKTVILCSHRLSTVRTCDDLIFLEEKEGVKERGESRILLKKNSGSWTYEHFEKQFV